MVRYGLYISMAVAIWLSVPSVFAGAQDKAREAQSQVEEKIDFERARQLLQKSRSGEKLTAKEQAYLDRARELRRSGRGRQADRPRPVGGKPSLDILPLTDLGAGDAYKGQGGGLYGGGENVPPAEHLNSALEQAKQIQPLNSSGKPDPDGKIALISSGMSNVTQESLRRKSKCCG